MSRDDRIAIKIKFENISCAMLAKKSVKKSAAPSEFLCCLIVITTRIPKVWPPSINQSEVEDSFPPAGFWLD